ncbi:hypothetical protein, partial [Isoptericola croceus]|uniref:hypothetical protein n=1 Tax=Isoptericola croceus TaxID=3031406 RepID=UPI0023F9814E
MEVIQVQLELELALQMRKDSLGGGFGMVERGSPSASIQSVGVHPKIWPSGFLETNPYALGMHRYQFVR